MGTTRIKVIDLSSDEKEIKTSRKHAEKITGAAVLKEEKKEKKKPQIPKEPAITEAAEVKSEVTEEQKPQEKIFSKKTISESPVATRHHHLGKKYHQAASLIDKNRFYPAKEAIELLSKTSFTKFDPTIEIHLNVVDKNIRGKVNFPHAVSKKKGKRYLIFDDKKPIAESTKKKLRTQKESTTQTSSVPSEPSVPSVITNQIIWGDEKTIEEIAKGTLKPKRDFDQVISTPKFMPLLAKVAKILGPAGLMPNPKNGTITEDLTSVRNITSETSFEYKTDPTAPIIHTSLGKLSEKPQAIEENLKVLIASIGSTKIKKAVITSSMGPGIKLDVASL